MLLFLCHVFVSNMVRLCNDKSKRHPSFQNSKVTARIFPLLKISVIWKLSGTNPNPKTKTKPNPKINPNPNPNPNP